MWCNVGANLATAITQGFYSGSVRVAPALAAFYLYRNQWYSALHAPPFTSICMDKYHGSSRLSCKELAAKIYLIYMKLHSNQCDFILRKHFKNSRLNASTGLESTTYKPKAPLLHAVMIPPSTDMKFFFIISNRDQFRRIIKNSPHFRHYNKEFNDDFVCL